MKQKRSIHRALSLLLTGAMILNMGFTPVFANGTAIDTQGLKDCHTMHDDNCGYSEIITMDACPHKHDDTCGYTQDTEEQPGKHSEEDVAACSHLHDETCQKLSITNPCKHSCEACETKDEDKADLPGLM